MENKKNKYIKFFGISIVILFFVVYIIGTSGYYESQIAQQTMITEKKILEFEEDILNGEIIDLNEYMSEETKNYENKFTQLGESINNGVITVFNDGIKEISNIFSYLLT